MNEASAAGAIRFAGCSNMNGTSTMLPFDVDGRCPAVALARTWAVWGRLAHLLW
jgi:hypothetical protein